MRGCAALFGHFHQFDFEGEVFARKLVVHVEHGVVLVDGNHLRGKRTHGALEIHRLAHGKLGRVGNLGDGHGLDGLRVVLAVRVFRREW